MASSASSPPSIAILNGTSRTGAHVTELALAAGSDVHLLVRSAKRVSPSFTEKPSPKLHVHELADLFSPSALAPILKRVDFLVLIFVQPHATILAPTSLNTDAAVAAVAAVRAGTPAGSAPRTKVLLLSSEILHPDAAPFLARLGRAMLPSQMADLARATSYLRTQEAWGLEWAALHPGRIVEAGPAESVSVRMDGVRLSRDAGAVDGQFISYGRLAGAFVQATQDWGAWRNTLAVPVPAGDKVRAPWNAGLADAGAIFGAHAKVGLRKLAWTAALLAVGWQVGVQVGDFGTGAWLRGLTTGLQK